jgi:hypothetical protein
MLIRLLVAVLTLVGPLPLRVCTCATAHPALTPESHGAQHNLTHDETVQVDHLVPDETPIGGAASHLHSDCSDESRQPIPHERECPAGNPRPLVREAVSPPTTDLPSDYDTPIVVTETPSRIGPHFATSFVQQSTRTSNVPLYLTFLALRN